jgi:thiol-disulfide isomerase/thioredoxin
VTTGGQPRLRFAPFPRLRRLLPPWLRRVLLAIVVLAVVQLVIVLIYRQVADRGAGRQRGFPVERIGGAGRADALVLEREDRSRWNVGELRGRPVVLHFWATWCRPCRDELPTLVAQAQRIRRAGAELVLVSVDDDWSVIEDFFGGVVPADVSRATSDEYQRMTTGVLPETLVVDAEGALVTRVRGARDWRSESATTFLDSLEHFDE